MDPQLLIGNACRRGVGEGHGPRAIGTPVVRIVRTDAQRHATGAMGTLQIEHPLNLSRRASLHMRLIFLMSRGVKPFFRLQHEGAADPRAFHRWWVDGVLRFGFILGFRFGLGRWGWSGEVYNVCDRDIGRPRSDDNRQLRIQWRKPRYLPFIL